MTPLKDTILAYSRMQAILAGAALLLIVAFYLAIYRPAQAAAADLAGQVALKQNILTSNQNEAGRLPRVQMQLEELRRKLGGFKKLPNQPEFAEFIRETSELSQKASLKQFIWHPALPKKTDLYFEQPVTFQFEGDFANVFSFVRDIEDMQRLTRVRSLDMTSISGQPGMVTVTLTVNFYYTSGG
jgi:Tfp pilus assembly protein PilO